MTLTLTHSGQQRTLAKHQAVLRALRAGAITEAQASARPWYLRLTVDGRDRLFRLPAADREAIRAAKDILNGRQRRPDQFRAFLDAQDARRSITIGQLAAQWIPAGLPHRKTDPRTPAAAARLRSTLDRALPWWKDKAIAAINPHTIEDYAAHRSPALRSADLELASLSSLCQWAVLVGHIQTNPFGTRPRFAKVKTHCHEACPDDDETLHRVLAWLLEPGASPGLHLAGGTLAFCALTGLRPGEPAFLLRQPPLSETPANTRQLVPGAIFPDRAGALRMKVQRLKHGQNPFITLHPAAIAFLTAWRAWLARYYAPLAALVAPESDEGGPDLLFPLPGTDHTSLNRALDAASAALDLPHFKPHGFGRAYYVRVRRSQGADDATIAGELGQTTNGELIRSVYGDPEDLLGGSLFDWLPAVVPPAWDLLGSDATSMLRPNEGMIRQDRVASGSQNQDKPSEPSQLAQSQTPMPTAKT